MESRPIVFSKIAAVSTVIKNAGPPSLGKPAFRTSTPKSILLKQEPQTELDLPRLVKGRGERCPKGRDESAAPVEGIRECLGSQVRIVQNVKHLCPELHLQLLAS